MEQVEWVFSEYNTFFTKKVHTIFICFKKIVSKFILPFSEIIEHPGDSCYADNKKHSDFSLRLIWEGFVQPIYR